MVKAVLFDFGNVLYRVDYRKMTARLFPDREEEVSRAFLGGPLQVDYECGRQRLEQVLEALGRIGFEAEQELFLAAYLDVFSPVEGMREIIEALAPRVRLGLLSNTSREHARLFIEKTPEVSLMGPRVYSFELGCMKPDPRLYQDAARRLQVPVAEIAYVDDIPEFVEGAERTGMRGIRFRSAAALRAELRALGLGLEDRPA